MFSSSASTRLSSLKFDDAFRYSRCALVSVQSRYSQWFVEMRSQSWRLEFIDVIVFPAREKMFYTDRRRNEMMVVESDNWVDFDTTRIMLFIATPKFLQFLIHISSQFLFSFPSASRRYHGIVIYNISRKKFLDQFTCHLAFQILSLLLSLLSFHNDIAIDSIITTKLSNRNVYFSAFLPIRNRELILKKVYNRVILKWYKILNLEIREWCFMHISDITRIKQAS